MRTTWQLLYNGVWHLLVGVWLVLHFVRGSRTRVLRERLALYPPFQPKGRPVIWFHASSLGEVMSLIPLLQRLRTRLPHSQILSVSTVRGEGVARQKSGADCVVYLPLDLACLVRRALHRLRPDLVVVFETEIWPNFFWECGRYQIPVVLVSGRISPRSFPRYRLAAPFFSSVLADVYALMQSAEDRERLIAMGASPTQTIVGGDIKFDGIRTRLDEQELAGLQESFGNLGRPVIVAGSTHEGEEQIVIATFQELKQQWPHLSLIIAPRHLTRLSQIQTYLQDNHIPYTLRTQLAAQPTAVKRGIILLDTYGELGKIYWLADVVFVGGSLVPVGGHNLAEPAAFGKPVLFGPYTANCKKQAQIFLEKNAACLVKSGTELTGKIAELLAHPATAQTMGDRGQHAVVANQGAMDRCIEKIVERLPR